MALRIGINGLGRIGRLALRHVLARRQSPGGAGQVRQGPAFEVVAANDLATAGELAYLLSHESVHRCGLPKAAVDGSNLVVNGQTIALSAEKDPSKIPWAAHGVDVVLDCTGRFVDREGLALHLTQSGGPTHVLLSAPGKGMDKTVVVGVNEEVLDPSRDKIISCASCTTNAITPVLGVLDRAFGIRWGLVGTTHAYTHGQGLVDVLGGKDLRRGRAAAINIVPTSTGAAKAVSQVLPGLSGKVDGTAVRVPVPNGSLFDLTLNLEGAPELSRVLETLRDAAQGELLRGILDVRQDALVSSDIIGDTHSSIVDVDACMGIGALIKIVGWYDNEWAYAARLIDLLALVARSHPKAAA
jgi:glyceraldehyde 3-phosphate dehydrogenase